MLKGNANMIDMKEAWQWGEDVKELIQQRKKTEQSRQCITFGKKTVSVEKGKRLNFADFFK